MKTLENKTYSYKEVPITSEKKEPIDTVALLTAVVEGSSYPASQQIIRAMKIVPQLVAVDGKIEIEDEDFKFIKEYAAKYMPLIEKGLMFGEFFQQLENA